MTFFSSAFQSSTVVQKDAKEQKWNIERQSQACFEGSDVTYSANVSAFLSTDSQLLVMFSQAEYEQER